MFDPTKNDHAATVFGPRIEFDLSLSSTHVLNAILKKNMYEISELRPGMPELSKFNALPFIAHKNMSLPQCALEKLRDVCAMEDNRTSAAPTVEVNDHPVYYRDDQPEQRDEQQAHTAGLEQTNINDKVVVIDDADNVVQTNNGNTTRETSSPSSEMRMEHGKSVGTWFLLQDDQRTYAGNVKEEKD
ncbi:hypothetical protein Bca101_021740 [Brassica carinata]